jgi:aminoglycoside 2''-phosphotransferase
METFSEQLKQIQESFPDLHISSVAANPDGLINHVLIVNEEMVFRFPKNDTWARQLLANEIRVIDLLRKYVDMPMPVFEHRAEQFVSYKYIPGNPLMRNDILSLDNTAQDQLAEQLATFLQQMHCVPIEEAQQSGIAQSDVNRSHDVWCKLFEDIQRELFPLMMRHTKDWVVRHFGPVLKDKSRMDYQPMLINGDVTPYHILYDKEKRRVSGIIDFGTAGIGDPAADFACIIYQYGESFLRRMAKYYPMMRSGVERARFWAGTLELQWALRGIRSKDPSWFVVHVGGARDVLPEGIDWA